MREAGLDHIPVVVGGIISPEDELVLKNMGVRAVYTPKDYAIDAIMIGLAKVVNKSLDRASDPSEPPREGAQVY
jgi:(2R)-ethylmalonyl-CoA mutase